MYKEIHKMKIKQGKLEKKIQIWGHNFKRDCYKEFHLIYHTNFCHVADVADVDKNYCYKFDLITLVTFVCCTTVFRACDLGFF